MRGWKSNQNQTKDKQQLTPANKWHPDTRRLFLRWRCRRQQQITAALQWSPIRVLCHRGAKNKSAYSPHKINFMSVDTYLPLRTSCPGQIGSTWSQRWFCPHSALVGTWLNTREFLSEPTPPLTSRHSTGGPNARNSNKPQMSRKTCLPNLIIQ